MSDDVVRIERQGPVAVWTICREARRNAISPDVADALQAAADEALRDTSVRAVVLTGEGERAFISGADLGFLASTADGSEQSTQRRDRFNEAVCGFTASLGRLPLPVIAAIRGHVMGGGCEIALACDMRVASPDASFTFKHAAMGVIPGWGGFARLTALVPRGSAARLLMTGHAMDAAEALRVGLVDEVAQGDVMDRALALASAAAELCPEAIAEMKQLLGRAYGPGAESGADERAVFARRAHSADHLEALRAFSERRRAQFAQRPAKPLHE